jgi:hypothetical protein
MINPSLKNLFKKDVKTICLSIGGIYAVFGVLALGMVKMQTMMLSNFDPKPDESFMNTMKVLHKLWIVYMPLLVLLGIGYLVFGLLYYKIKVNKFQINLVLSVLSVIWVFAYALSCIKYLDILFSDFEPFKYIAYVIGGVGFIAVIATLTVPQYIIGKKIRKEEVINF